jgi:O-antigen/teichoic acid export membrane protein
MGISFESLSNKVSLNLKRWSAFPPKTLQDTIWVLTGNTISKIMGLVSFTILTRILGPQEYGIYSLAMMVLSMAIELSDLGINASTIRYGAQYFAQEDWESLKRLYSIVLKSRLGVSLIVFGIGYFMSLPLANLIYHDATKSYYLVIAFGGIFFALINSAFNSILQASQKFKQLFWVNLAYGTFVLVGIAILAWSGRLTSINALYINLIAPLSSTILAYFFIPRNLIDLNKWDNGIASKVFHFGKWMALWAFATIIQSRLDTFMLSSLSTTTEVGYFSAAYRIATLAQIIPVAYGTVLNPKISSLRERETLWVEFKKSLKIVVILSLIICLGIFIAPWIIPLLTGPKYLQSITMLQIQLIGMALFSLNLPFSSTIYAIEKSFVFATISIVGIVLTFVCNIILIPLYGAVGSSITFTMSQAISVLFCSIIVIRYFKELKRKE